MTARLVGMYPWHVKPASREPGGAISGDASARPSAAAYAATKFSGKSDRQAAFEATVCCEIAVAAVAPVA